MLAAIWFVGTVAIGWLLVWLMKRGRRSEGRVGDG
jgi:hypothetical protein